jgi:hypothetical protein
MEYLVAIVIVAIAIGLLILFLRRAKTIYEVEYSNATTPPPA